MDEGFSWKRQMEGVVGRLAGSSVRGRVAALAELEAAVGAHGLTEREATGVVVVLRRTAGEYADRASRAAAAAVVRALATQRPAAVVGPALAAGLGPAAERAQPGRGAAAATRVVLLSWITAALAGMGPAAAAAGGDAWRRLVAMAARLLWSVGPTEPPARDGSGRRERALGLAARRSVWRMVRAAPGLAAPLLDALAADAEALGEAAAALAGNVASAAMRARGSAGRDAAAAVAAARGQIVRLIDERLISSRARVSYSSAAAVGEFLRAHVGGAGFAAAFGKSIGKMLVRAPESVLPTCLWLVQALERDLADLAGLYADVIVGPAAGTLLRSSDAGVRAAAAALVEFLSAAPATEAAAEAAAAALTGPLEAGRFGQPDQRAAAYAVAGAVRAGPDGARASSAAIAAALVRMAARETHDAPAAALFAALGAHVGVLLDRLAAAPGDAAAAAALRGVVGAAERGLALPDRAAALRRGWAAAAVGEPLWQRVGAEPRAAAAAELVAPVLRALAAVAERAAADPLAAGAQLGEAHVGLALALRAAPGWAAPAGIDAARLRALAAAPHKSLVLWDKAFHRCAAPPDAAWLLRAAHMLFAGGCDDARLAALAAWTLAAEPRAAALDALAAMSRAAPARLWATVGAPLLLPGSSYAAAVDAAGRARVLAAVAAGITRDLDAAADLLVAMAPAWHHPAVAPAGQWIALVQRAGVDPAVLCRERLGELVAMAAGSGDHDDQDQDQDQDAVRSAIAHSLVLVGGEDAARRLLEAAHAAVDPDALAAITDEDLAVWRTPAGQLHHDPLAAAAAAAGKSERPGKQGSSADAWVAELQAEIARKKGQAPRLTRAEEELVARQAAAEDAVRRRVARARAGLRRALRLVRAVAGVRHVAGAAMADMARVAVARAVVGGGARACAALAGDDVAAAVAAMGAAADGVAPALRAAVGAGLLRARGLGAALAPAWRQEPLPELASRVLFQLRVGCEAAPLPPAGFNFVLPLLQAAADAGGWGRAAPRAVEDHDEYAQLDPASEQLAMAADLLRMHAHLGCMRAMPRREMLALLVQLMAAHPPLLPACRAALVGLAAEMEGSDAPPERAVLLAALAQPDSAVRCACLAALDYADLTDLDYAPLIWLNAAGQGQGQGAPALDENARLAAALWADNSMELCPALVADLVPLLASPAAEIRACCARALAMALAELPAAEIDAAIDAALADLQAAYHAWLPSLDPDYDEFGIVVPGTQHRVDAPAPRIAVADALLHVAPLLATPAHVQRLLRFLVEDRVLGERDAAVRARMLDAGACAVETHGARWADHLMPTLERFLAARDAGSDAHDHIREGVVVLLGRLAQHLPADQDARVAAAVDQLLDTLSTPSEPVQSAVSQCLPPLAKRIDDDAKLAAVVERLMHMTLAAEKYSHRRGGAFGLAGVAKGRGLAMLKRFEIVDRLRAACEDRAAYQRREGALFAFETLAAAMGRLFEPYVIQFAPMLLALFSDPNADVRDAALDTARVIMQHISGHGVKLILPSTLAALADPHWRTKKGSVEVLGAMAYCAPKQLSIALPTVVPRIIDVLTDTHGQVADAARRALVRFGEVINNPEIQHLVPVLLAALDDPAAKTDPALRALLHTAFVHYIDAPSLALVVPILQRGMRARAAVTKRNAAQIMGSMATLTDPKDLTPYLPDLVPLVRAVLTDPVPEARATAAKALGSLVQRLREDCFPNLVADLVTVLKSDASGVDRAGAAQGLSEVLSGIGVERLEGLLPEVVANCRSPRVPVREGFMTLLVYLPTTFGDGFQQFLPQALPLVLAGLADESELVRGAAQRAGRILVAAFARSAMDTLLPDLLASMQNEAWRIRHSSIELLGEFLFRVAGITDRSADRSLFASSASATGQSGGGDNSGATDQDDDAEDEDENERADSEEDEDEDEDQAALMSNLREVLNQNLGVERCRSVLAALYVARSDVAAMVRQAAFGVWKGVVSNTPRTVRECLPTIMEIVLVGLSSDEHDRRTTAARTLGDLVHKLGEAVMSQIVPILENALRVETATTTTTAAAVSGSSSSCCSCSSSRHGVFVGLSEILAATGRAYIDAYTDAMIPLVRRGLCDDDVMVREAAATAFNGLQQTVGTRVIDLVVPPLLNALTQSDSGGGGADAAPSSSALAADDGIKPENALEALRELMAVRANVVFPVLIPTLTAVPVSAFNARALSSLIQVSGGALGRRLPQILVALFESFPAHHHRANGGSGDAEAEAALRATVTAIAAAAVRDEAALEALMMQLHESVKVGESVDLATAPRDASRVAEACRALGAMYQASGPASAARGRTPLGAHVVDWLRILIDLLGAQGCRPVVEASWAALDALCRAIPKDDYDGYVGPVSRAVQHATEALPRGGGGGGGGGSGHRTLPGFNLPKGVGPLLPIYSQGLLAGSADTKERAVRGIARLVRFTEPDALRPFATGITGPLIRIVGDRHPPQVKAAILATLGLLLEQIPALMRPFLPQLQRTFMRGLGEPEDVVRRRAAAALAALIPLQARLDPLVLELTAGAQRADGPGMRNAMMRAICAVVQAPNAADNLSPASVQAIEAVVVGGAEGSLASSSPVGGDGDARWQALRSEAFGGLCGVVDRESALRLVAQHAAVDARDAPAEQAAKLGCLAAVLAAQPALVADSPQLVARLVDGVGAALTPGGGNVRQVQAMIPAVRVAKCALMDAGVTPGGSEALGALVQALVRVVAGPEPGGGAFDSDTQHAALAALKTLAKHRYAEAIHPVRAAVVQAAMAHVRARVITVKLAAERCALYALRLARVPRESFDGSEDALRAYVDEVGGPASDKGRQVLDYHRRVLNKLADATRELDYASDDEDDPSRPAPAHEADSDIEA
ncbi:translational activator of GCN4 [Coemansia javaensis]|uniref:Translational activator of GCN4 n=1 Tax=Coemansia javaensis TaxID=2761396 RepID=A0A9W8HBW3_9FUNG|nr:translational activator of GCN4 [Coemansia javaensis]